MIKFASLELHIFILYVVIDVFIAQFQRAPEELERVMAGVEAYLSIRKGVMDVSFNPFPFGKEVSEFNVCKQC